MTVNQVIEFAETQLPGEDAADGQKNPRWEAIFAIGEYVESQPEQVWEFVSRWGRHPDRDIRSAIASCLLEHLFEFHFDLIFPRVERLVEQDTLFADTFASCWKFGQSELPDNARRFDELKRRVGGDRH